MNLSQFVERLPKRNGRGISAKSSKIWFFIHAYVCRCGQVDRYDAGLRKELSDLNGKWLSDLTIKKYLRDMEIVGLLQAHQIKVKYTKIGKAMLPFGGLFNILEDGPPPGAFTRYTLPGMQPTLYLNNADSEKTGA
jgi:hypothetical protein